MLRVRSRRARAGAPAPAPQLSRHRPAMERRHARARELVQCRSGSVGGRRDSSTRAGDDRMPARATEASAAAQDLICSVRRRVLLLTSAFATLLLANAVPALACACCTNTGQRLVETEKLSGRYAEELARIHFRPEAKLKLGEGYDEAIKGLIDPNE